MRRLFAVLLTIVAVLAAGWLALRRADIPYDTLETMYSVPDTQFMTLDSGLKVHFTDTGPRDAATLVLVHGFSASLHTWAAWKADLEADYRLITLDLPGHGLTRAEPVAEVSLERFADVVAEVTEKLEVERFTLAGNSMGGATAWVFALNHNERLDGLILVDASGWPDDGSNGDGALIFRLLANPIARTLLKDLDTTSLTRSGLEDSYVDQSFVTDDLVNRYVSLSRAPGHRDTLLTLMEPASRVEATPEALASIAQPTLVMWGREDNLVPVGDAQKFADAIPNADLVIYDDIGHLPQEEAAEASIADVREFMLRVEWEAMDAEVIEPAGDPRLLENRN